MAPGQTRAGRGAPLAVRDGSWAAPSPRCVAGHRRRRNPGRGAEVNSPHEPRLLIYSQDGFGLGHQRRTTLLADEFLRSCPGASALTVSDSPLGKFFSSADGHDYCKLPSVRKVGPGDWQPVALSSSFAEVLEMRRSLLQTTVRGVR